MGVIAAAHLLMLTTHPVNDDPGDSRIMSGLSHIRFDAEVIKIWEM